MKLHLGCGPNLKDGWVNVDLSGRPGVESWLIDKLPVPDESVDEILAEHLLEHLTFHEVDRALNEWYRVLRPDGRLTIEVPNLHDLTVAFAAANEYERYVSYDGGWALAAQIYGHQRGIGREGVLAQVHKCGFTKDRLYDVLAGHHFEVIAERPPVKAGLNLRLEAEVRK